jgi:hypothetical protein
VAAPAGIRRKMAKVCLSLPKILFPPEKTVSVDSTKWSHEFIERAQNHNQCQKTRYLEVEMLEKAPLAPCYQPKLVVLGDKLQSK